MAEAVTAKVFVNNVDLYTSREVGQYLAKAVIGATRSEDDEDEDEDGPAVPKPTYTVVGTLSSPDAEPPAWVSEIIPFDGANKEGLQETLLSCQYVVWDIMSDGQVDSAAWAVELLRDHMEEYEGSKTFICLSTLLTWAKTTPQDREDPEAMVMEEEFRRRRPHLRYKPQIELEKLTLKLGRKTKGKLKTFVVCSGVPYGAGEDVFHHLFQAAWHQDPAALPCFGDGQNVVPTVHVTDLAAILLNVIESPPEAKYVIAADESRHTLWELTSAIAENLGTGKVTSVTREDGISSGALTRYQLDMLQLDLRIEAAAIKDMAVPWIGQTGLIEAIAPVITEYKTRRNLLPLKLCILGPTGSGKLPYAERLCRHYKLHLVKKEEVMVESMAMLEEAAEVLKQVGAGEEIAPEVQAVAEDAKEKLEEIKQEKEENGGVTPESRIITWMQAKLKTMACLNQGYVLCGFPETEEQANQLFIAADDAEDPEAPDPQTVPEFVFGLEADDEFLRKRTMSLPEGATAYTEESFNEALAAYRAKNTEEATVLNYFDFKEIHPTMLDVEALDGFFEVPTELPLDFAPLDDGEVMKKIVAVVGDPHNYGPTPAEQAELEQLAAESAAAAATKAAEDKALADAEELALSMARQEEWDSKLEQVRGQATDALEASAEPLRNFLVRHVMPTLTEGLVEVSKAKPDDPVDFLAEYLFRNNPTPLLN